MVHKIKTLPNNLDIDSEVHPLDNHYRLVVLAALLFRPGG
jgi:hypothetical protein